MSDAIKEQPAALAREWARLRADFWDFGMLSWIPVLLCALLWWTFSAGIARDLPIAVIDNDHSTLSRQLTRWLDASPGVQVAAKVSNPRRDRVTDHVAAREERPFHRCVTRPNTLHERLDGAGQYTTSVPSAKRPQGQ